MTLTDILLLSMVCILRLAFILLTLTEPFLNPLGHCSIYFMVIDSVHILAMFSQIALLKFMRFLHITAQFILLVLNCFWLMIIFWPMLFYKLYSDPNGRSIYDILSNPRNSEIIQTESGSVIIQQHKRKQKPPRLRFYNRSRLILTSPASQGAYAHVDEPSRETILDLLQKDLWKKQLYYDDPLLLKVPYEYLAKRQIKPPDSISLHSWQ